MTCLRAIAGLAAGVIATGALAETITVEGTGMGRSMSDVMQMGEDLTVVHTQSDYTGYETGNPESPFASLAGPCFGTTLIDAGEVSGDGYCSYTDADGDMVLMQWQAMGLTEEGRTTGEWSVRAGTGKWADASGGGSFDAGGEGEDYTNKVTGEVEMP